MAGQTAHLGVHGLLEGFALGERLAGDRRFAIRLSLRGGDGFFEKLGSPPDLAHHRDAIGVVHAPIQPVALVEIDLRGLVNAGHGEPFRRGIHAKASAPDGIRIGRESGVHRKGLWVSVDAVVHVEPVEWRGGEVIARAESADLDAEFVLEEFLLQHECVKSDRLPTVNLLDGELIPDVLRREIRAIAVEGADRERGAVPAEEFFKIQLNAKTGVVRVGEALAHAADRIACDVVGVGGGNLKPRIIEVVPDAPPIASQGIAAPPIPRANVIGWVRIVVGPKSRIAKHLVLIGLIAKRRARDVARTLSQSRKRGGN